MKLQMTAAERIMEAIVGATIVHSYVENEEGMHIVFSDGRALVIAGVFGISLVKMEQEKLH